MKLNNLKNNGFSLIEIMISASIMIIVIISLTTAMLSFLKMSNQNNDIIVANQIIKSVLESSNVSTPNENDAKPSEYSSSLSEKDKYFSIEIKNTDLGNNANRLTVIVSKGIRNDNSFNSKRFLSQSAKVFYD